MIITIDFNNTVLSIMESQEDVVRYITDALEENYGEHCLLDHITVEDN